MGVCRAIGSKETFAKSNCAKEEINDKGIHDWRGD